MYKVYVSMTIRFIKSTTVFEDGTGNRYIYTATITKKFSKNTFMVNNKYFISKADIKENCAEEYLWKSTKCMQDI